MYITTAIANQNEINKDTIRNAIILLKSTDLNIYTLKVASNGSLYTKALGKEILSEKIAVWEKQKKLLTKLHGKKNLSISTKLDFILSFINHYLFLLKEIKKPFRINELHEPIKEGFILTNIGKLILGLSLALLEMDYKLEHCPDAVRVPFESKYGSWGTPYGLKYLIRKTAEHTNINDNLFIEKELNTFFNEWRYE